MAILNNPMAALAAVEVRASGLQAARLGPSELGVSSSAVLERSKDTLGELSSVCVVCECHSLRPGGGDDAPGSPGEPGPIITV